MPVFSCRLPVFRFIRHFFKEHAYNSGVRRRRMLITKKQFSVASCRFPVDRHIRRLSHIALRESHVANRESRIAYRLSRIANRESRIAYRLSHNDRRRTTEYRRQISKFIRRFFQEKSHLYITQVGTINTQKRGEVKGILNIE